MWLKHRQLIFKALTGISPATSPTPYHENYPTPKYEAVMLNYVILEANLTNEQLIQAVLT